MNKVLNFFCPSLYTVTWPQWKRSSAHLIPCIPKKLWLRSGEWTNFLQFSPTIVQCRWVLTYVRLHELTFLYQKMVANVNIYYFIQIGVFKMIYLQNE